jgi:hypothetical protein
MTEGTVGPEADHNERAVRRKTGETNQTMIRIRSAIQFDALRFVAAAGALATVAAIPSLATTPVTFAQYTQANGAAQDWSISTSGITTTITESGAVNFTFSGVTGLPFSGPQAATFVLSATSTSPGDCGVSCGAGDSLTQFGYTGTFQFTDTALGTDLLSGVFAVTGSPTTTGAQFESFIGSSGGSFDASATAGNLSQLVMSSAYLVLVGQTQENASFSLSSLVPNFAVGTITSNTAYPAAGPFNASGTGTFSSNPGPSATPDPASIALMAGGLIGLGVLRRKKLARLLLSLSAS